MEKIPQHVQRQAKELAQRIKGADKVLVGIGAGFSAGAGLSYMDEEIFEKYYPDMYRLGYRYEYQLVGMRDDQWSRGRKWAYWATHINYVRNIFMPAQPYKLLLDILQGRDWFAVTSNCDRQLMRNGFPMERVFEYQGNYDNMGCSKHCTNHTWDNHEALQKVLENIDRETFECREEGIPKCPYCGADADICFRGEDWRDNAQRYVSFVDGAEHDRLLLVELGVGFNTPGVIRYPFERITYSYNDAFLARINTGYREYPQYTAHPEIPRQIEEKSMSIDFDACDVVRLLHEMI
ncbi:MAG: hypothetical protein IJ072_01590 [Oscillospiraceae bacterium]|nr:hypothetical protein [Oscillospiraceae bacterium]